MVFIGIAVLAATALVLCCIAGLLLRTKAYRRRFRSGPQQNLHLGIKGPKTQTIPLNLNGDEVVLPTSLGAAVSGFLELQVRASVLGSQFEPAIEIRSGGFHDVQYLDRGASGTRLFNVSRLLNSKERGNHIRLTGSRVTWSRNKVLLHICEESVETNDRVLVIAPHPDDAEIAAYGLYTDLPATVVTLTVGDASERYQHLAQSGIRLSRNAIARIRVWNSLTIPEYSGLPSEQVVNLCFPDGRLMEMCQDPDRDFQRDDEVEFCSLRQLNRSPLVRNVKSGTWGALVHALSHIIEETKPTVVVCPHPTLDPHPDHLYATVAVCQALKGARATAKRMFFYTAHNRWTELWPFGPAGSGVPPLPILIEDGICASGFYSHALSIEKQQQKFVGLEAMHDIREIKLPVGSAIDRIGEIVAELRGLASGLGRNATSYLRRATRPDELFFVTTVDEGMDLTQRALMRTTPRPTR
jgi:LmbE family N-acetylglucosaminyl deacetylase